MARTLAPDEVRTLLGELVDATDVLEDLKRRWGLEADWFNWKAQGLTPLRRARAEARGRFVTPGSRPLTT